MTIMMSKLHEQIIFCLTKPSYVEPVEPVYIKKKPTHNFFEWEKTQWKSVESVSCLVSLPTFFKIFTLVFNRRKKYRFGAT